MIGYYGFCSAIFVDLSPLTVLTVAASSTDLSDIDGGFPSAERDPYEKVCHNHRMWMHLQQALLDGFRQLRYQGPSRRTSRLMH